MKNQELNAEKQKRFREAMRKRGCTQKTVWLDSEGFIVDAHTYTRERIDSESFAAELWDIIPKNKNGEEILAEIMRHARFLADKRKTKHRKTRGQLF